MERQPVERKGNQPVEKSGNKADTPKSTHDVGSGYSDNISKDEPRKQQFQREESEREPWSGARREKIELPGDKTAKYQ